MCTIYSNLPAPYPLTRYVGSAAIIEAIKTAALAAPDRCDASDRHPRTLADGAYRLPTRGHFAVTLPDGTQGEEYQLDAHGPIAPEPDYIHAQKVSILYQVGEARGRYTLQNTREGLSEWADKVRRASAAFDGKPKRARLPSKARTGGSAVHVTAKEMLSDGDALGAFTLAQTAGAVYFGQPANLYVSADHVELSGDGFTIGRNIRTGRFRVLHTRTGLAVDSRAVHGRTEGFSTHTAARDWIETQTSEPDFLGKLATAAGSREDFSQTDAQARFLNPDAAQTDATAAPDAPEACADSMAPETAIETPTAPIAADARRVRDLIQRFYQNHLSGAPGCTVSADALQAEAEHLRTRADEFADHAPQSAATYRAVAAHHEAEAERKRAGNIGSAWNDGARVHVPTVIPWETSAAVYRTHCITARLAEQVSACADGLRARGIVRIDDRLTRGIERTADAQDLRNRVARAMRERRNFPAPLPATSRPNVGPLPATSVHVADPVPVNSSDPVPGKFKVCVTLNSGKKVNASEHYPAAFKSEYATPSDAASAAHASGLLVNLTVNPIRAPRKVVPFHDKPLAIEGLTSYRYRGRFGWILIGAHDHDDALREAQRSTDTVTREDLQVWNGTEYVDAYPAPAKPDVQANGPGERDFDADESEPAPLDGLEVSDFGTLDDVPEFADTLPAEPAAIPLPTHSQISTREIGRALDVARTLADAIDSAAPDAATRSRLFELEARRVATAAEASDFVGTRSVYRTASTMLALKAQTLRESAQRQPLPALTVPAAVRRIGPAITVPRFDPRARIPARFAPVYTLRA